MWGINFEESSEKIDLPLITDSSIFIIVLLLLIFRVFIYYVLEKYFSIRNLGPEHETHSLEYEYFYHLSIIILVLSDLSWNLFDLSIWIISYVCVGMVRKTIHIINVEREQLLNGYSYNCKIAAILSSSKVYGIMLFLISITYYGWINYSFGYKSNIISILCFPITMLAIDSLFMLLFGVMVESNLNSFYNPNIVQISPLFKYQIKHKMISYLVKLWHYYKVMLVFVKAALRKAQLINNIWILSIVNSFSLSGQSFYKVVVKYSKFNRIKKKIDGILVKEKASKDRNCTICLEPLLNCFSLRDCGHCFHYRCSFQWIQTKSQCPVCRAQINLN